ncbi:MAG TPA: hypothetical protein VHY09_10165, partial [Candidatus Methylacidiphilales bacterium]|nr:hypothetical protein [Candidatus Methylacidiphilales bacterium]
MKTAVALPGETWVGLLVIFIILASLVQRAPGPKTSSQEADLLQVHEGFLYFLQAEQEARRLVPDSSFVWSRVRLDRGTQFDSLGNGVWLARGKVSGDPEKLPAPPTWAVLFVPETKEYLFVRVGRQERGDAQ